MAPVLGIVLFALLLVLDYFGHRKFRPGRKLPDWIVLCLLVAGLALFVILAILSVLPKGGYQTTGRYIAYRYLMDEDADSARAAILQDDAMNEPTADFMEMLCYGVEGDYKRLYFTADTFMNDSTGLNDQKEIAEKLYTLSMNAVADGSDPRKEIRELVEESYEISGITETVEMQEYYDLDSRIRGGASSEVPASKVRALINSFPEEKSVQKLAVSYYAQTGDFDSALEVADNLMQADHSAENEILYTDVLAQMAWTGDEERIRDSGDKEVASLVGKADAALEKAENYDEDDENALKQIETANRYFAAVANVYYQRVENYITVKKPFTGDKTGLYDLQLIKMQMLKGEKDKAYAGFLSLLEKAPSLAEDSPVREALTALSADLSARAKIEEEDDWKETFFRDCKAVFRAQSEDVISVDLPGINRQTAQELAARIIYDTDLFEITGVDTLAFPKVAVTVHTNVQKDNIIGGAGEFYKDDFRLKEDDATVEEFSLTASVGMGERRVAIALDLGAADGTLIRELQAALVYARDSKLAKQLALIGGNADLLCGLGDSDTIYTAAVRNLSGQGSAQTEEVLSEACEILTERKYEEKAILLITDGLTEDEAQTESCLELLRENGIACYVIDLSEDGEEAARRIAAESGAFSFTVDEYEELTPAVQMTEALLNNSYLFTYKTTDDSSGKHTVSVSLINEDLEAAAEVLREEEE